MSRVKPPELAEIVGRSVQQVYNWEKDGCPRGEDGKYDTAEVFEWFATRNAGLKSAAEQKTRLTRAQADKAELEAARLRAEQVPVSQVERQWTRMLGAFRARVLSLPSRVASLTVAAPQRFEEHRQILDDAVYECLNELAGFKPDGDLPGVERDGAASAPKADGKRVGRPRKGAKPRVKRRAGKVED